ncbi:MAG: hypothetical protein Q9170_006936 [Blastenia crenularia]
MNDPVDNAIETNILHLEWLANEFPSRSNDAIRGELRYRASQAFALRESITAEGSKFAERVVKVQEKLLYYFAEHELEPLRDFIVRQKQVALQTEIDTIKEDLRTLEDYDKKAGKAENGASGCQSDVPVYEITSPPSTPELPLYVEVMNMNTSGRMLASKDEDLPFILKFFEDTGKYQLVEKYCMHSECYTQESLIHYYIDSKNLGLVAWAPGSSFVHTQTQNYKKGVRGDFCNVQVRDLDCLEYLVEHMKRRGIMVQQVTEEEMNNALMHG